MNTADHEHWSEYVGAYVLGAVGEQERSGFEAHLAECHACRDELRELQPVSAALTAAVPPRPAPPDLGERIMGTVRPEAELLRSSGAAADRPPRRARRGLPRLLPAGLAAGALAAAAAFGFVVGGGDGTQTSTVAAKFIVPSGTSARIVRPDHPELVVAGFPASPAGRVYQVWAVSRSGGAPKATGKLFVVGQDGSAAVPLPPLGDVRQVMVTAEQPGGSPTGRPSGAPVFTATLT